MHEPTRSSDNKPDLGIGRPPQFPVVWLFGYMKIHYAVWGEPTCNYSIPIGRRKTAGFWDT